jgi:uncharacterized Ntn-hydrolase superfamily protein
VSKLVHGVLLAIALTFGSASEAAATYSIVAVDESTGEVGGAGASCVGSSGVARIYGSAPGIGVLHAQASSSPALRDEAARRLFAGESPSELLAAITDPAFDRDWAARQYGVVSLMDGAAGFTGTDALPFADDAQGTAGPLVYSVQGNILTGERVLDRTREAFVGAGCDLPERLMLALEAAGTGGEGDRRCTGSGVPADAAFIQVDRPDEAAGSYLFLEVRDTGTEDPVALLRARFDGWRAEHPCPELPDAGAASADAGAGSRSSGCTVASGEASRAAFVLLMLPWIRRRAPADR